MTASGEGDVLYRVLLMLNEQRSFDCQWHTQKIPDQPNIAEALKAAGKQGRGGSGKPDLLYCNKNKRLLIIGEVKPDIGKHATPGGPNPEKYAVDGAKHYLGYFFPEKLEETRAGLSGCFDNWMILALAVSGDPQSGRSHRIDTYALDLGNDGRPRIRDLTVRELLDEDDYAALFKNTDIEKVTEDVETTARLLNEHLRNLDSQKRPILLSACMICLFPEKDESADFRGTYKNMDSPDTVLASMNVTIRRVLESEAIPHDKIETLVNELAFCKTDHSARDVLGKVLEIVERRVVPLLTSQSIYAPGNRSAYDILGKFYHRFLTYAGVANVKNGIVLTPSHICDLFSELVEIKTNDVILDPACGTGSFLIAGMNKLISTIRESDMPDKEACINSVKQEQLVGFEINPTMWSLSVSNMLFRGDGKSRIHNLDFFSDKASGILDEAQASIGFMNPPYGGRDSRTNPTKKEIQFLERLCEHCSRYVIVIAPWSAFIDDEAVRERILVRHTLLYSINMPADLFQPNASTHTAICVFETHRPHGNNEAIFYDVRDDGLVLDKVRGRVDLFNRWAGSIKPKLLKYLKNPGAGDENGRKALLPPKCEWIIQDHKPVTWEVPGVEKFEKVIKEYAIFLARRRTDRLGGGMSDVDWIDLVDQWLSKDAMDGNGEHGTMESIFRKENWKEFQLCDASGGPGAAGLFTVRGAKHKFTQAEAEVLGPGDVLYVSTSNKCNGVLRTVSSIDSHRGPVITVDSATDGKSFYQHMPFVGTDHVECLVKKNGTVLNVFTGLFIVAMMDHWLGYYGYGRKRAQKRLVKETVFLPCKDGETPDWDAMERVIKSVPYSSCLADLA